MIEAYIIDKLKREKEELERQQWEPTPLPLEVYDPGDREERPENPEKKDEYFVEIPILFSGRINGSITRV
jgi:restriction endonuclease S subunit